ncbi:peroxiredoxin, partial [[Eubacterium] cellulosolvens]
RISLQDLRGKKVLLYFYPKDNTPGCTREAMEFRDTIKEFETEDTIILGVSNDTVESHKKFKIKFQLPFILLSDPDVKVLKLYDVWKKKNLYGKSYMGTERATFLIDDKGVIKKIYRKVKVDGHAQTCLVDLKKISEKSL